VETRTWTATLARRLGRGDELMETLDNTGAMRIAQWLTHGYRLSGVSTMYTIIPFTL
jgi:hypothetical protein